MSEKEKNNDARHGSRQSSNNDEGVKPRLEINDDQHVDKYNREA
jgi:hypothetical protein